MVSKDTRRLFSARQARIKLEQCGGRCDLCGLRLEDGFHMHHIKRHADGGQTVLPNCMALCPKCHKEKHSRGNA